MWLQRNIDNAHAVPAIKPDRAYIWNGASVNMYVHVCVYVCMY